MPRTDGGEREFDPQMVVHIYRGELHRSDTWRTRLDTTTNWALAAATAVISFAFASRDAPAAFLLIGLALATNFLLIEARRYRYYDLWIRRVRLLEDGFIAPMLRQEPFDPDAARELAAQLTSPALGLSVVAALAIRFHRGYMPIVAVLAAAYLIKLHEHPAPGTLAQTVARARIGPVPGALVLALLCVYLAGGAALIVLSRTLARPPGELASRPRARRRMAEVFRRG